MGEAPGVSANKALVDTSLGLVAQIVVNARDHHDEAITSVGRLADKAGVVLRLAALNMPDDHAPAAPRAGIVWIAEPVKNLVCHFIRGVDDRFWHTLDVQQLAITTPVEIANLAVDPRVMQPGAEILGIDDGAEAHAYAVFFFDQAGEILGFAIFDLPCEHRRAAQLRDDVAD